MLIKKTLFASILMSASTLCFAYPTITPIGQTKIVDLKSNNLNSEELCAKYYPKARTCYPIKNKGTDNIYVTLTFSGGEPVTRTVKPNTHEAIIAETTITQSGHEKITNHLKETIFDSDVNNKEKVICTDFNCSK